MVSDFQGAGTLKKGGVIFFDKMKKQFGAKINSSMVFFFDELSSNPVSDGLNFHGRAHLRYPRTSVFLRHKAFLRL
jgi:hypothetical protein